MTENEIDFPSIPDYIPVKKAAEIMGISRRRINDFVKTGRISAFRAGRTLMLLEKDVLQFQRQATGRKRTRIPIWRLPVGKNIQFTSIILTRIKPGQSAQFDEKLQDIHAREAHLLPGTVARYFSRSVQKPDDVQIIFVWRSTVMPSDEEREASIQALQDEFADILDWEKSWGEYGKVVMHT